MSAGLSWPLPYRLRERLAETPDDAVFTWHLEPQHEAVAAPQPGQFNMLYLFGVGEVPISLSAAAPDALVHTLRAAGAVTAAMCGLWPGATLGVRGPFGSAWPLPQHDTELLVIAGGIGLAPLRPAIEAALAAGVTLQVLIGAREPEQLLYGGDLARWARAPHAEVHTTVDRAGADWRGQVGVVTRLVERARIDAARTLALICGPELMMRFTVTALERRGLPAERIYLSMERNMHCALGHCGHCQWGGDLICRDGPVFRYDRIAARLAVEAL